MLADPQADMRAAVRLRGCGMADELPVHDEVSPRAIAALYGREAIDHVTLERMAEAWRPYRMWAIVLLLRFTANRVA
jgi:DNA-3-methyladenine glycosylase II